MTGRSELPACVEIGSWLQDRKNVRHLLDQRIHFEELILK